MWSSSASRKDVSVWDRSAWAYEMTLPSSSHLLIKTVELFATEYVSTFTAPFRNAFQKTKAASSPSQPRRMGLRALMEATLYRQSLHPISITLLTKSGCLKESSALVTAPWHLSASSVTIRSSLHSGNVSIRSRGWWTAAVIDWSARRLEYPRVSKGKEEPGILALCGILHIISNCDCKCVKCIGLL